MKKNLIIAAMLICSTFMSAQENTADKYVFTTVDSLGITPIKDQNQSGTCWSFSSIGLFESELIRLGKGEFDLSEMFVVHKTMEDRARASVRTHGDVSYAPGGSFYDVIYCYKNYGMVPNDVMPGIKYDSDGHNHSELANVAGAYVNAIANGNSKRLTNVWHDGLSGIYDAYLGECPETFTYNGKEYTPRTYADEVIGLNMDDYISLTSFSHHPFYETFILEIPDNWRWAESYNLPLEELMEVMKYSIKNGFTFAWASDVSESGFARGQGIAIVPEDNENLQDALKKPMPEKTITQEIRQIAYDNWETTDDHGMQIFGITKDQNGKEYYMVKNSWNTDTGRNGIWYASEAFVAYKTINIVLHKDGIPKAIRKKLGIK
ncbi:MAG: aminopeptidase [Bacteroidaceae bacterium]|nr:aminopeptidase [Bacteroidaceae bacterium]